MNTAEEEDSLWTGSFLWALWHLNFSLAMNIKYLLVKVYRDWSHSKVWLVNASSCYFFHQNLAFPCINKNKFNKIHIWLTPNWSKSWLCLWVCKTMSVQLPPLKEVIAINQLLHGPEEPLCSPTEVEDLLYFSGMVRSVVRFQFHAWQIIKIQYFIFHNAIFIITGK